MNTKEPQCILFEGAYTYRTVYRLIASFIPPNNYVPDITASGNSKYGYSFGNVSINGTWYDVRHLEDKGYWYILKPSTYYPARRPTIHTPSKELRKAVLERDGYICLMCGSTENLRLDHIKPVIDGGDTTIENLQTLCRSCNSQKGPHSLNSTEVRRTQWSPGTDWAVARRLIHTLNRHGFTNKDIAEITGLPQQSVTRLANRGHGRYETFVTIEKLAAKAMPELRVLAKFIEGSNAEEAAPIR